MQKRKKIIIFLSLIIIILISSVVMAVIYIKTDFLKSNKQLFFKYLIEENQMFGIISSNSKTENNQKSYTSIATINYIYEYSDDVKKITDDQIGNNLKDDIKKLEELENLTGSIKSSVDKKNKNEYYKLDLQKNEVNIMNIELVRNQDKYALKSDQVVNSYIGFENNNLKDLCKKMGIENNEIIPNQIDLEQLQQILLEINPEEKEHIYQTYKDLLMQSIESRNYSKQKNQKIYINNKEYSTNLYSLSLTKTESMNTLIKILHTLKQDSITLNLICNKIKLIDPESKYTSIENLTKQIDLYIEEIEKNEKSDIEFIRIDVYSDKKAVRKVDISFYNQKQISFEYEEENGKENLQIIQNNIIEESSAIIYDLKESLIKTKKIKIIKEANFTTYQFVMYNIKDMYKEILDDMKKQNIDNTEENKINIEETEKIYNQYNKLNNDSAEISLNIKLENNNSNKTKDSIYLLICNSKIGIDIEKEKVYTDNIDEMVMLNNSNSIMLNKYSKDTISKLLNAIYSNGQKVLKQKIGIIQ